MGSEDDLKQLHPAGIERRFGPREIELPRSPERLTVRRATRGRTDSCRHHRSPVC
jgi:hypothetical protein